MENLTIASRENFGEFVYGGRFDADPLFELIRTVQCYCAERGWNRALVDVATSARSLGATERLALGKAMGEVWDRRVALAALASAETVAEGQFFQLASQNQGVRVRIFSDRIAAEAWLAAIAREQVEQENSKPRTRRLTLPYQGNDRSGNVLGIIAEKVCNCLRHAI